jgi:hypothetical protein
MQVSDTAAVAVLKKHHGKVAPAARDLGCSRAHLHALINGSKDLKRVVKAERRPRWADLKQKLEDFKLSDEEVIIRQMNAEETKRAAALAVVVEKLAEDLRVSKRDLAKELARPKYAKLLAGHLPPVQDQGPKRSLQVTIFHTHREWLARKPKGTVPSLLVAAKGNWPAPSSAEGRPYGTSYLLAEDVHAALHDEAGRQDTSVSALVRAVLDRAMAAAAPASPLAAAA